MIKSMTGYGSSQISENDIDISVDIKSVNNKYLDIILIIPKEFQEFENNLTSLIKEKLNRGRINVSIIVGIFQETKLSVDLLRAKEMFDAINSLKQHLNLDEEVKLNHIISSDDIIIEQARDIDKDMIFTYIAQALNTSLDQLNQSRQAEGERLYQDLSQRINAFEMSLDILEARSPFIVEEYKEKLNNRLSEIIDIDDEFINSRLSSEIVLFAEKSSITEELVRLRSHLDLFKEGLESDIPIGKKLDFICQELLRESNTIGSKSNDTIITNEVIEMKTIIDQLREKVQNIE